MPARVNPDVPGEPRLLRKVGKRIRELRERRGLTMAETTVNNGVKVEAAIEVVGAAR